MAWTLRKKILVGHGITLVLMIVVFVWAFINLLRLGKASDAILRENYKSILAAENMINALERQDSAILLICLSYEDDGLKQFRENESQFLQWLGRAKDNITLEGEKEILSAIDTGYSAYLVNFSKLRSLSQAQPQQAVQFYHESALPSFKSVRETCTRLRELNEDAMFKASTHAQFIAERAIWSMGIVGLAAMGMGLGFSLFLSNLLVRPLRQMMDATQKVAEGNYDVNISTHASDELGHLSNEFNVMVKKLKAYHNLNVGQIVAEKQKSEAILQSIDDGIVVVDAKLQVTHINPTAAKALGVERGYAQQKHFLEVVKNEMLFNYIKQAFDSGQPPPIEEDKNVFTMERGEKQLHYQFSITPVHTKGTMAGVILLLRNVTKLKELDRLKSEFVMMASHELRTPLTSIGMGIDLLLEMASEKLNEREQQLLSAAHEEAQRLKAIVNDLLNLSKIEAGKIEMEFSRIAVSTLLEKAASILQAQAENNQLNSLLMCPMSCQMLWRM